MSDLLTFSPPGALDTGTKSFAGAKATFFNAGTTTPRTVYTDQAETIPAASPLVADAAGLWPEIFASGGAVKVVVTYSDDTTGYTLDPCTKVAAAGAGAASVSFTPSILRPYDNVQEAIDSGTFPARTITPGGGIAVTNGDGVAGNPTISATLASGTAVTASGTSVDFTGIPSWARRVTVLFNVISTNGTSNVMVQLGDAGGFEVTGYAGAASGLFGGGGQTAWSNGALVTNSNAAAVVISGAVTITNISGNVWVFDGCVGRSDFAGNYVMGGVKTLSDVLTQIRVTTAGGADTFDAGTLNVMWE